MDKRTPDSNPHVSSAETERFAAFEAALEREGFSPSTRACYASDWWTVSEHFHAATGKRFRLDRFTPDDFVRLRAELAAGGAATATLNRRLAFFRRYTGFAATREPALVASAAAFGSVQFEKVERRASKALTHGEEQRVRAAADALGLQEAALVALLLGTGLRGAEAAELRRDDLRGPRDAPTAVHVRGARAKTVLLAGRTKARVAEFLAAASGTPGSPLFRSGDGEPLGEDGVAAVVDRVARAAGVEATPRTLRHTFGVRYLSEHRDDLEGVAQALGHTSLAAARAYRAEAESGGAGVQSHAWSQIEEVTPSPGVRRRAFAGSKLSAERDRIDPGSESPPHAHPEEQITFVLSGRVAFRVGKTTIDASAGAFVHVPASTLHAISVRGRRPAVVLHVYAPPRRGPDPGTG